jgi:hypothetical protein
MIKLAKNRTRLFALLAIAAFGLYLYFDFRDFLGLTTLSISAAESHWGNKPFSAESFKNGTQAERASAVADLVRSNRYIGKNVKTVISELGTHDAYHNTEGVPAYSLPEVSGNSWTLVFLPDDAGTIRRVLIHKECCYRGVLNLFLR